MAWVSLNDIVERGDRILWSTPIGVRAVIEKPLKRFRFEILARREENGEPAPAESVDVGTVTHEKFRHRNAARCRRYERRVVDESLVKLAVGREEFLDMREIIVRDGLLELTDVFERLDVPFILGQLGKPYFRATRSWASARFAAAPDRTRSLA